MMDEVVLKLRKAGHEVEEFDYDEMVLQELITSFLK
jgi:hypothetical protein